MQAIHQRKPRTFVVLNPVAGKTETEHVREKIESALSAYEIPFEVHETRIDDDVEAIVRQAVTKGFGLIVAAGGDGTQSAAASGLVGSQVLLAVIPTGTWNALARTLDIPLDIDAALGLLFQEHQVRAIDAMQVDGHYHLLNISAGLGSKAMRTTKRAEKRRFGKLADLWHGLLKLLDLHSYRFEVVIDGRRSYLWASELMVANGPHIGVKAFKLDPEIRLDDGKLNVCRINARNLVDYFNLGLSMLRGEQRQNWNVLCLEAEREVEIRCDDKLPLQADGEVIGRLPALIRLRKSAIHIVTPAKSSP